jgi:RimJ/RimL family protein N-acetyltransferase
MESSRLFLRERTFGDEDVFMRMAEDPEVTEFVYRGSPRPVGTFGVRAMIRSFLRPPKEEHAFAVIRKTDDACLGMCQLTVFRKNLCGEMTLILRRDAWGQGYATEAGTLLVTLGFAELKLHRIQAKCDALNVRSRAILEKFMKFEGCTRHAHRRNGAWHDVLTFSLLADEFRS